MSDQLSEALAALRRAGTTPGFAEALLGLAAELTAAEAAILARGGTELARHGAPPPALTEVAAAAEAAGTPRVEGGPEGRTALAVPCLGGALGVSLRLASPLHAALTRERLQLLAAQAGLIAAEAARDIPALLGAVLPAALAEARPGRALHVAAAALAALLPARRVAIGAFDGPALRHLGVSDAAEVARGSEEGRRVAEALGAAQDGIAGPAVAAGAIALLAEGLPPGPRLEALARGLAPLARLRGARAPVRLHAWQAAVALGLVLGASFAVPREAEIAAPFVLAPREKHVVTAPFDALLEEARLEPGDPVRAGDTVLARLSTREVMLELSATRARAASDRREAEIARARGQPAAEMVAALAAERTEAQVALLEDRLTRATVRAPVDGMVVAGDLRRQIGQPLARGQVLHEIARVGDLRAEILVLDADAGRLREGASVLLSPAADPGRRLQARVERVSPMAEQVAGRNVVRAVAVLGEDGREGLRAGMEGEARVTAGPGSWGTWLLGDAIRALRMRLWL